MCPSRPTTRADRPVTRLLAAAGAASEQVAEELAGQMARFAFTERASGTGLVVVSDRDRAWKRRHDVDTQPWDAGSIQGREGVGVLGVFDDQSVAEAPEIIAAVAFPVTVRAGDDRVASTRFLPHPPNAVVRPRPARKPRRDGA